MSQLNGFDACTAAIADTNTLLAELMKDVRLLTQDIRYEQTSTSPVLPSVKTSPPAQNSCASTPPELPPQPISASVPAPAPARSFPPSQSVEDEEEVEQKQVYKPLRNIK